MNDVRQEWATPKNFFGVVDKEFGFTVDVCAHSDNAKCPVYITQEQDALNRETPWFSGAGHEAAWLNPGFSHPRPWCVRSWEEVIARKNKPVVVQMGLAAPSTEWWAFCVKHCAEIRLLSPRVQFDPPSGIKRSSNSRENALFIWRHRAINAPVAQIWTWDWKSA